MAFETESVGNPSGYDAGAVSSWNFVRAARSASKFSISASDADDPDRSSTMQSFGSISMSSREGLVDVEVTVEVAARSRHLGCRESGN